MPPLTDEDLTNRFYYHPPTERGTETHKRLSDLFFTWADEVNSLCPDGREKSLAMTKLEEAKFWASAAVARNPETR